jgi:magnesium-transporting ATPase (P-type)
MEIALLKLLLAHILGDFFLQPNSWVAEKEKKKLKADKLYLHIAIHIALIFLVFGSLSVWKISLLIGVLHGIIDAAKLLFQKEKTKRVWFFVDQLLHVVVIVSCWQYYYQANLNLSFLQNNQFWLFLLGALFLTSPAAIFIRVIIARWIPGPPNSTAISTTSLQDAGKFIGVIERLLIYLFVCANHFEAVGFLLAAKSIFRFGDLKDAHDIKLTEYVLIGTLLSFGLALIVAMSVLNVNF